MKKRKLKIKWLELFKFILEILGMLGCLALIIHDLYKITIYSWITSNMVGWTWFGFITFILAFMALGLMYEDLEEKWNAIPTTKKERA